MWKVIDARGRRAHVFRYLHTRQLHCRRYALGNGGPLEFLEDLLHARLHAIGIGHQIGLSHHREIESLVIADDHDAESEIAAERKQEDVINHPMAGEIERHLWAGNIGGDEVYSLRLSRGFGPCW